MCGLSAPLCTPSLKQHPAASQADREARYVQLTAQSHALGLRYAQVKGHPCKALCQRLLRHEDELFQFVLVDGLSADNNQAERSIRPLVVIRKISGGSRSDAGNQDPHGTGEPVRDLAGAGAECLAGMPAGAGCACASPGLKSFPPKCEQLRFSHVCASSYSARTA
jgi:hypothetical protein